jgi:hypothetical protein
MSTVHVLIFVIARCHDMFEFNRCSRYIYLPSKMPRITRRLLSDLKWLVGRHNASLDDTGSDADAIDCIRAGRFRTVTGYEHYI